MAAYFVSHHHRLADASRRDAPLWRSHLLVVAAYVACAAEGKPSRTSQYKGAFFGAVVGDALALGTHFEYDAKRIKEFFGEIDRYYASGEMAGLQTHSSGWGTRNYHSGNGVGAPKRAGETTDAGDYNILMLEHLAATSKKPHRVDLLELIPRWQKAMKTWRSRKCSMTRLTLSQVAENMTLDQLGGVSNAMSLRSAAAYAYYTREDDVVHAARIMMFTHRETTALDGAEYFARVAFRIIHKNMPPRQAIVAVASMSSPFIQKKVQEALDKVAEATDAHRALSKVGFVDDLALTSMGRAWEWGTTEPIKVGKASPTEGVLPGAIYLILKYLSLPNALRANAMIGGDSASRAIPIGMVLGAWQGVEAIPKRWREELTGWRRMEEMLEELPLIGNQVGSAEVPSQFGGYEL